MATDGVKIIDGDTAHDTYWGIMDLYDSGANIDTIQQSIPFVQPDYYDDFDYEIFVTSYALAFWEIGFIDEDIIEEVKKVIGNNACVRVWTEEYNEKEGKARQKVLDKFWKKINSENTKIRKRKKYKKIEAFIFEVNDVLSFQLSDNLYYATIVLDIHQHRGQCSYHFGKIVFQDTIQPTIEGIKDCQIIGRKIPSGANMDMDAILALGFEEIEKQGGLETLLKNEAERTGSYQVGMSMTSVEHKDLTNFASRFVKIGNLELDELCRQMGSIGGALTFEDLTRDFEDLEGHMKVFKSDAFDIKALIASE